METRDVAKEEVEKADLVSMKLSKEDRKKSSPEVASKPYEGPEYPYSTRLDFDDEVLKKLGIAKLPELGKELTLTAKVEVTRTSESEENGEKKRRSMCLQITRMKLS